MEMNCLVRGVQHREQRKPKHEGADHNIENLGSGKPLRRKTVENLQVQAFRTCERESALSSAGQRLKASAA